MTISPKQAEVIGNDLLEQAESERRSRRGPRLTRGFLYLYWCSELARLPQTHRSLAVQLAEESVSKERWRCALLIAVAMLGLLVVFIVLGIEPGSFDPAHGSLGRLRGGPPMVMVWMPLTVVVPHVVYALYVRRQVRKFATELAAMSTD